MIISFPQTPRVIISCEMITETRRHSSKGVTVTRNDPPALRFFVDYEDNDGCFNAWDGPSYAAALAAARECAADGAPIRDRTSETWGHT